jgi:heptosyltransferase I
MKILIIKTSALGDVAHALPVLDYLSRVAPQAEIDWVVDERFAGLLEGNPLVRKLHVIRPRTWRKHPLKAETLREIREVRRSLREADYDLVFDIQGNLKSGIIGWLTGGRDRVGFTADTVQEQWNLLFTTRQVPLRRSDCHVTDQYLRVVSVPFGRDFSSMQLETQIATTRDDDAAAEALLATLSDGLVFLFQYGTTWQTKFWSNEGWIDLGRSLLASYPESSILFAWGSDEERRKVMELAAAVGPGGRVIDRYSLKGIAALLKRVDAVIGGDTGIVHIAAVVGTPTVSFYRASDGRRSGPRGPQHVIVQSPLSCARCFRTRCDRDEECRASIKPQAILAGIAKILGPGAVNAGKTEEK